MNCVSLIFTIIGAASSLGCFIIAVMTLPKITRSLSDATFFGDEAIKRFDSIKKKLSKPPDWGPMPWGGGKDVKNMFEIKAITYDPATMGNEWKGCKKSIRRVYPDKDGNIVVEGWRLK